MSASLKVLAVEPWFGGSHQSALSGLAAHSSADFRFVTLPPRFWKWRMQGSAVTMAAKTRSLFAAGYTPDVVLVSSMLNVPAFVALARPTLDSVPVVLYMHENQLTYVLRDGEEPDHTYGFINYLSCLAADAVAFNSEYHREAFLEALSSFLRRLPDHVEADTLAGIRSKSSVLHLGIDCAALDAYGSAGHGRDPISEPLTILWNHRWEHDKNPEAFFRAVNRLDDEGYTFNLVLLGEDFEQRPPVFDEARRRYGARILRFGWESSCDEYREWLHRSDVVVSTANHEFFGLAVVEAVRCGCHPILPNRLSYPEIVRRLGDPPAGFAPFLYGSENELVDRLRSVLERTSSLLPRDVLRQAMDPFGWHQRAREFDDLFRRVVAAGRQNHPDA